MNQYMAASCRRGCQDIAHERLDLRDTRDVGWKGLRLRAQGTDFFGSLEKIRLRTTGDGDASARLREALSDHPAYTPGGAGRFRLKAIQN